MIEHSSIIKRTIAKSLLLVLLCTTLFSTLGTLTSVEKVYATDATAVEQGIVASYQQQADAVSSALWASCGIMSQDKMAGCIAWASFKMFYLATKFSNLIGNILNWVVQEFVFGMGLWVGNMTGVIDAWEILRDLANIFLVFLTLWIGITTIVGVSSLGGKQLLFRIILAALLVNFSITFAKVIIDVSNLAAGQTYLMMTSSMNSSTSLIGGRPVDLEKCVESPETAITNPENSDCLKYSITEMFWSVMRVTTLFSVSGFTNTAGQAIAGTTVDGAMMMTMVSLLGVLVMIILAFVLGASAFMLLGRFIILVFVIIISPIAFVMWITGVGSSGSKWWHTLLAQSFFAPALFLLWWIALKVLAVSQTRLTTDGSSSLSASSLNGMADAGILVNLMLAAGFLIASLLIAKQMGAYGASAAVSTGQKWSRRAGFALAGGAGYVAGRGAGLVPGAVGAIGRNTVGRWSNAGANSAKLANAEAKGGMSGWVAGKTRKALEAGAKSNFDARSISKGAQGVLGGPAGKGGYKAKLDAQTKEREEVYKRVGESRPTADQSNIRDTKLNEVDRQTAELQKEKKLGKEVKDSNGQGMGHFAGSTADDAERELEKTRRKATESEKIRQDLLARQSAGQAVDPEALKAAEKEAEGDAYRLIAHQDALEAMKKRTIAEKELSTGVNLTAEKQTELTATIADANKIIKTNYGSFNSDIDRADQEIARAKEMFEKAKKNNDKAAMTVATTQIQNVTTRRDRTVEMLEAKDEKARIDIIAPNNTTMRRQADVRYLTARNGMEEVRSQERQSIISRADADWKAEAVQRQSQYANQLETAERWQTLGIKTPAKNRIAAQNIRKNRAKPKKERLMEELLKDIESGKYDAGADSKPATNSATS